MKIRPTSVLRCLLVSTLFATAIALHAAGGGTAVEPVPRDPKWVARHEKFVEIAKQGGVDVLFLGDSITDFWASENKQRGGKAVWDKNFAPLHAANFGISADRTQHVLWRMQNGELEGIKPKVVVLLIGTNNCGMENDKSKVRNTTAEAIQGVTAVVQGLRAKLPETKILFLAIFPRGEKDDPIREQIKEVNAAVSHLDDGKYVHYLDIGPKFLEADGSISHETMGDLLHPTEKGYEIWAAAIKEPLAALMK
jgi:lysophospholipase L1-like esterase